jgi:hypothetical protein
MSRRRKRRRKSSRSQSSIQVSKKTSSAGANFLSFILGMATTVVITLWAYTAITTESVQAEIAPVTSDKNDIFSSDGYDEIEALMDSEDVSEVVTKLAELNEWPRDAELPVRVSANRNREKLAKKILRMDGVKESDRVFTIDSLIEALSAIYGLDFYYRLGDQQASIQLREVAESHLNDTNAQVVRAANLALLKHHAFEYVKQKAPTDEQYQLLESTLFNVLDGYPNDKFALSNVRLIFKSLSQFKPGLSAKLTNLLLGKRPEYAGTKADQLIADLADADILLETRYTTMFENRWVNGRAGRDQLLRESLKLLGNESAGRVVIEQVDQVAQWFEQQNKIEQAREIYQAMVDEAGRPNNPIATKTATALGQNGLTRCDSLGKPAVFSGVDIKGRPISKQRYSGRIVAVVFWSVNDSASKDELLQLHQERTQYSSLPVDIIAVCIERNPGTQFAEMVTQLSRFHSCNPAKYSEGGVPFMKQVPITKVPQILLIDQQRNISDTNVPSDNLRSHIEYLASKR